MKTLAEPRRHIYDLWGKQIVNENNIYRLMKYVMCVDHENDVLLHNIVTGQLVLLDTHEKELLSKLPCAYSNTIKALIEDHFLVPFDFDEHAQVKSLRLILRKLDDAQTPKNIVKYAILPTTACNARCYYCFEQDVTPVRMSEQTADDVIDYITKNCGKEKRISVTWYGGEPTTAADIIDRICNGLIRNGITFDSGIITNGYAFTKELVERASKLWHLRTAQVAVDGTEINHNKIKSFVGVKDNPYKRVLRNVGLLLDQGIKVNLRMNFDIGNYKDFQLLLNDLNDQIADTKLLQVYATPVLGEHADSDGVVLHGDDAWMVDKICELNNQSRQAGLNSYGIPLPALEYCGCSAADDSYMIINPSGSLLKCLECISDSQAIGNIYDGILNNDLVLKWKQHGEYSKCANCIMYPWCMKMANCSAGDRCYQLDAIEQFEYAVHSKYLNYKKNGG